MGKLYVDLDAVLVDFNKGLTDLMGFPVTPDMDIKGRDDIWAKVDEGGADFWASMKWMPDGRRLWEGIKGRNPTVLSAPSRDPSSKVGKNRWVDENLGTDVAVILDKHKERYANPGDILIDDRMKNIKKWESAGGVGILHTGAGSTLRKLREIGSMTKTAFKVEMVEDPSRPGRRVPVIRDRGGRSGKAMQPKKGGPYKREKRDWARDVESSAMRVVGAYLLREATWQSYLKEISDDYTQIADAYEGAYRKLQAVDPKSASRIARDVESRLESVRWMINRVRHDDVSVAESLEGNIRALRDTLRKYPPITELLEKRAAAGAFKFRSHPVVIDPYDAVVQQAHRDMGPAGRDIDVIKLEATCPGERVAWVTNQDLFGGEEGKKRVVHLCLDKIKQQFRKVHGSPYTMGSPVDAKRMKELVLTYLKDVVLPHEAVHIEQETKGEGQFGPSPELGAERAEQWADLEQMGVVKKAGFFPEGYDPEKGEWVDRPTRAPTKRHERRNPLFSFKRLNSRAVNEVRRKLLDLKDPRATKIWDYIQTGLMGDYTPEQEDELRRIIENEARDYNLEVGGMVNSLFRGQPMRESPLYQKFAARVVMRYLSECNT